MQSNIFDGWADAEWIRSYREREETAPDGANNGVKWLQRDGYIILYSWIHHQFNRQRIDFSEGRLAAPPPRKTNDLRNIHRSTTGASMCVRACVRVRLWGAPESPAGKWIYSSFGACACVKNAVLVFVCYRYFLDASWLFSFFFLLYISHFCCFIYNLSG